MGYGIGHVAILDKLSIPDFIYIFHFHRWLIISSSELYINRYVNILYVKQLCILNPAVQILLRLLILFYWIFIFVYTFCMFLILFIKYFWFFFIRTVLGVIRVQFTACYTSITMHVTKKTNNSWILALYTDRGLSILTEAFLKVRLHFDVQRSKVTVT